MNAAAPSPQAQRTVVVSAVNLVDGGTLSILRDCLPALRAELGPEWKIVALVHDRTLAPAPGVEYIEFPAIKASYRRRLVFEYWTCRRLSRRLDADLWIALHDLTPVVRARRQVVYCHNPIPFYRLSVREMLLAPVLIPFDLFYNRLYGLNIRRNHAVIVQQDWLRDEFKRRFGVERVIVARPVPQAAPASPRAAPAAPTFVYPTMPRVFKNLEMIGEAVRILEASPGWQGTVLLTVDGTENAYARRIRARFGDLRTLHFLGLQSRQQMDLLYARADALVFPSKLETWGMPLSEAQTRGLPIIAADLPYAHETVGGYARAAFFDPADPAALAAHMLAFQNGRLAYSEAPAPAIAPPFAPDWPALVRLLTAGL